MEDIPARDTDDPFDVGWSQHLHVLDRAREIGSVGGNCVDNGLANLRAPLVPGAFSQVIRCVLHEGAQRVLTRWSEPGAVLGGGLNVDIHEWEPRRIAPLAVFPGCLEVVDRWIDDDSAGVLNAHLFPWHRGEIGQLSHADQQLDDRPLDAHLLDPGDQVGRQVRGAHHAEEGAMGIGIRDDDWRSKASPIGQTNAGRGAIRELDFFDFSRGQNLDTAVPAGVRQRLRDRAHASAHKTPCALVPIDRSNQMMELDIGSARIAWTSVDSDHTPGGIWRFDLVRLEIPVEQVADARLGQDLPILLAVGASKRCRDLGLCGRRTAYERLHPVQDAIPHRPVVAIRVSVLFRVPGDLLARSVSVQKGHEVVAIGKRDEVGRLEWPHVVPVLHELQIVDHFGQQQIADI